MFPSMLLNLAKLAMWTLDYLSGFGRVYFIIMSDGPMGIGQCINASRFWDCRLVILSYKSFYCLLRKFVLQMEHNHSFWSENSKENCIFVQRALNFSASFCQLVCCNECLHVFLDFCRSR